MTSVHVALTGNRIGDLALLTLLVGALLLLLMPTRNRVRMRMALRMQHATARPGETSMATLEPSGLKERMRLFLCVLGERVPLLNEKQRGQLVASLICAGYRDARAVSTMVGLKVLCALWMALGGLIIGMLMPWVREHFILRVVLLAFTCMIGFMLPEFVLGVMVRRRKRKLAACLPDALDLLVICTQAGNSIGTSVKRVALELTLICPPLADELSATASEMQMGSNVAMALRNLANRTGLASVQRFSTALIQSHQYGTPITQALRTLSRAERNEQLIALEEKAAKLSTKMTLPMLLFVLPTVILISAGPAAIRLLAAFK
jgi:tight adherence protein C